MYVAGQVQDFLKGGQSGADLGLAKGRVSLVLYL